MLVNILGFGSFVYFINYYLWCTPTTRTKIAGVCFKIGGCPYNQNTINPMTLRICNNRKRINKIS